MLTGYAWIGDFEESVHIFRKMLDLGVEVNSHTFSSILKCFAALGSRKEGEWAHGKVESARKLFDELSDRDSISWNSMVSVISVLAACVNCDNVLLGRAVHALAIKACFDRRITFANTLLDMYSKCGDLHDAILVFEKMGERSVVSWTSLIAGYAREDGKDVHNYIKGNDIQSNLFVCNSLMDMYAKCGSMEEANSVFLKMPMKDIISWNTMIGGYSKNGHPNEALGLFVAMLQELKPDGRTIACILPACASLAALDRGREIHGFILRNDCFSDQHVAKHLLTLMIAGYGMHGFGKEAIAAFNEMRQAGIEPDEVSFISILYACSHSGLLNEGWILFNIMQHECSIAPKLEHYACIVDLLARTGKLSMAYQFIKSMPIEPDATIWGALLCGCRIHHDVKLAEKVAEHVFELEPENTGYYVLLANIYSEAEKWEEVKKLRERIGGRGLKKNPGCSWIEVKGKVHIFVSGDGSHLQSQKIKSLLNELRSKMKEEGYFPKMEYSLINADDLEKEMTLCGHSEKLAMAFGILNLPPGKTIRVTKNLRVCGDCHEMAKFMSKITRRRS
ncbi:hypothetical protein GH714_003812 [Hevea brasiliensis]|uniref:DYW domain-containing protein n=1 Tax=Hevea brasiliensis TaxID=3981 RepID=A0A6A6M9M1_HEVBR|nr:hypothetical protein GH714_003812 [Hevea brasiliensis]